jgi:hypothetical protein
MRRCIRCGEEKDEQEFNWRDEKKGYRFSHPNPMAEFGMPVLTSGQCGFERMPEILLVRA